MLYWIDECDQIHFCPSQSRVYSLSILMLQYMPLLANRVFCNLPEDWCLSSQLAFWRQLATFIQQTSFELILHMATFNQQHIMFCKLGASNIKFLSYSEFQWFRRTKMHLATFIHQPYCDYSNLKCVKLISPKLLFYNKL